MDGFLGSLSQVIYFKNYRDPNRPPGYLLLAPYTQCPAPAGYSREAARTLLEIDRLERTLVEQEVSLAVSEHLRDEAAFATRERAIRDRLYATMTSGSSSQYEKDYAREWLALRDEKKRKKYAEIFEHRAMHLHARHNDMAKNRDEGEEKVSLDRVNF
jgi:hypothetical protein